MTTLTIFNKKILEHCLISHLSSEPGHKGIIFEIKKGAYTRSKYETWRGKWCLVASLIIKAAIVTHNKMATFSEVVLAKKISYESCDKK